MNTFLLLLLTLALASVLPPKSNACFEAIFNFGDSNSDTGGYYAAFPPLNPPYGMTYFGEPSGRDSDGRLILDFLAQGIGLPFVSPYLQSVASDFRHGANFAVVAAAVKTKPSAGVSVFSLSEQLRQFRHFKLLVEEGNSTGTLLPEPDVFGNALYTIYIGQNDFSLNRAAFGTPELMEFMQQVASEIANTTKDIYTMGGRAILVFNLAPLGCYPFILGNSTNPSDTDASGCMISCNAAVDGYNALLKAKLILVDTHAVLLQIFAKPANYGFEKTTTPCVHQDRYSYCPDPQNYVNWDGVHLTEAANKIVASAILGGSYFDPPFPINVICDVRPL